MKTTAVAIQATLAAAVAESAAAGRIWLLAAPEAGDDAPYVVWNVAAGRDASNLDGMTSAYAVEVHVWGDPEAPETVEDIADLCRAAMLTALQGNLAGSIGVSREASNHGIFDDLYQRVDTFNVTVSGD